jgi:hypothetical protein
MSAKPFLWLACGLAIAGCAGQESIPSLQARTLHGLQVIRQAELADIRAGNLQQAQQNQERQENVINTIRSLGVLGVN